MICQVIKNLRNIKLLIIFGIMFLLFFTAQTQNVQAAATTTIRGVAWWGDVNGYVYFNCKDDVMGDRLDDENNLSGGGKYLPPDDKFHFFAPPCLSSTHYVYIDSERNLRGQAWNQVKGFISFEGTDDPPGGYGDLSSSGRCGATCNASNNCWGCYVESQKKVYGWARVDLTGEWIRLDHALDSPVSIETCANGLTDPKILVTNSPPVTAVGLNPGDFHGLAVGHNNSLNPMYLNCKNDPRNVNGVCYSDYKVYIETLTIGALTAPSFSYAEACSGNGLGATLGWCVKSGQQKAYEIVVNKTDLGASPSPAQISSAFCKTGKVPSTFANQFFPNYDCSSQLEYGTNYYWWIRLYDEADSPTQWYQYFGNSSLDTDRNIDNNVKTFSTFKHRFPTPFFTWSPFDILVGTTTKFSATSSVFYTTAQPLTAQSCSGPNCHYFWTTTDSEAIFTATNTIETDIIFKIATDTTVSLEVTDIDNYMCKMTSAIIKINYDLPIWREIKAK